MTDSGQYIDLSQAVFLLFLYSASMSEPNGDHLKALREKRGLSVRELGRMVGVTHSNILFWESTGRLPRAEMLMPLAEALGVSVEQVLGKKPSRVVSPGGKVRQVFDEVSKLPRRQQEQIVKVVNALLAQAKTA